MMRKTKFAYLVPRKKSSTFTDIGRAVKTTRVMQIFRVVSGSGTVVYDTSVETF